MRNLRNVIKFPEGNPPQYKLDWWSALQKYEKIQEYYSRIAEQLYEDEYKFEVSIKARRDIVDEQISEIIYHAIARIRRLKYKLEVGWLSVPMVPRKVNLISRHDLMVDIKINDDPEYKDTYNPLAPRYWQRHKEELNEQNANTKI